MIGHTLSAAGAIEAVFSLMTMREGVIPPTINYDTPDPAIELDVVPNVKREAQVSTVLSNSFGFGGQKHLPCHGPRTGLIDPFRLPETIGIHYARTSTRRRPQA